MDDYTILCTKEQTKKALALGAPIKINHYLPTNGEKFMWLSPPKNATVWNNSTNCIIPTTKQLIEWLEEQGFYLDAVSNSITSSSSDYYAEAHYRHEWHYCKAGLSSYKKAILDAIDAALNYLENLKQ